MKKNEKERLILMNVDSWMAYIKKFSTPCDDFDRVRYHFLCSHFFDKKFNRVIKNILILPVMVVSLFITLIFSQIKGCHLISQVDLVQFVSKYKKDTSSTTLGLPHELIEEYPNQFIYDEQTRKTTLFRGYLNNDALFFWLKGCRYRGSFYMNFSVLSHLSSINKIIHMYSPKCILTTESENDFTTSALTAFCESKGIEYIGMMHGETFIDPSHAFVRFSRFYVWDDIYIKHYVITGSQADFFRVFTPNRSNLDIPLNIEKKYFIAYYLQGQSTELLKKIRSTLEIFVKRGLTCKVRLHPRATDRIVVDEVFGGSSIDIEYPELLPVERSYAESKYIVSLYSTVLTDAFYNDLNAVIDDVSNIELYDSLKKVDYVNLDRIKLRISDLIKGIT